MGRKKEARKRIGQKERSLLKKVTARARKFKVFKRDRKRGETKLNWLLMNYLLQADLPVENTNIFTAQFLKETFRPDMYLAGKGGHPLCAVECKKLTDKTLKRRWKEGLSQSLLYSHHYKYVLLVLYDYTSQATAARAFGRGRKHETTFARLLREHLNIEIVVLSAQ